MAHSVACSVQHRLVAAQVCDHGLEDALEAALDACGIAASGTTAALRRLLLVRPNAPAVLSAAANASGHLCAAGILLARLVSGSLVSAAELLAVADPAELALAVADLHAAAGSSAPPAPSAAAAQAAFRTLIKLLATSGDGGKQQRAADHVMAHLRQAWLAPAAGAPRGGMAAGAGSVCGGAALLLSSAVDAVDAEVFPRRLARRWLKAELGHLLHAASGDGQQQLHPQQAQQGAAGSDAGPGGSWAPAMAAFAAALPADAFLEVTHAAAWEAQLHPQRAAALLAAAVQQQQAAEPQVERWVGAQAAAALSQHAAAPLRALLLLQRELLLWRAGGAGSAGAAAAHHGMQQQQQQHQQQHQQQAAQQAYRQWFAATLVAPDQHHHLQFLVQQVLIPLVPEESVGCGWLHAQADVLAALLRLAQQPGASLLAPPAAHAAEEYLEAAKQRLKAEQAAAAAAGEGQAAAGGPAAAGANLQKGQALVAALLREYEDCGGELRSVTLNHMQAKAANVFTRGEVHNMLLPALLAPTSDEVEVQRRVAFAQYLYQELGRRGDTHIRPNLRPEMLAQFHRRCLQARLDGASLQQLVERAPQLLMAAGGTAAEQSNGGLGSSNGGAGCVSSHQVLDRLRRSVREELQRWSSQLVLQQQPQRPGSGRHGAAAPASSPDELACVLLDFWTAAYCSSDSCGGGGGGGSNARDGHSSSSSSTSGPSPSAVAAHLLSIAHSHPALHAPLLHRLRQRLLAGSEEQEAAEGQDAQERAVEAAVMLATVAGALMEQQGACSAAGAHAAAATRGPGALQPLYVWQQEADCAPAAASGAAAGPEAAHPRAALVPGPMWLHQLLLALPLSSAAAMARAAHVAAAHLSCLRHFRQHCRLPVAGLGGGGGGDAASLALRWQQAGTAGSARGYDGEFVARLVFPACTASLRLLQWLLLRHSVGGQLPPARQAGGSSGHAGWDGVSRPAKRQRGVAGAAPGAACGCEEVLALCGRALRAGPVAPLAVAAGGLPLAEYLRLEAAASGGGGTDLLPLGAAEAALRLCCALYLQPRSGAQELASLVQPLAAAAAGGSTGSASAGLEDGDVLTIPDSEDEDGPAPAGGAPAASGSTASAAEALGAAAAAALAAAAEQGEGAAAAAVSVCQRVCGHSLRLIAPCPGSPGLPSLLAQLLASAVQHSRQQLAVQAVVPGGQQAAGGQWWQGQRAAVQLRITDPQQAGRIQQAVAALAGGLALDLLPLSLAGSGMLKAQQRRMAAAAEVVQWALRNAGLGAQPAAVQQRLEAALEGG